MSELIDALNQLQKEKNIEKEVIMQAIEDSLVAACKQRFRKECHREGKYGQRRPEISLSFVEKTVVEEVEGLRHGDQSGRREDAGYPLRAGETLSTSR